MKQILTMKVFQPAFLFLFLFISSLSQAQRFTISGYIEDESSGEKLIGANVYDAKTLNGTASNTYGFFSLTLPEDSVELVISYIGYQPYRQKIFLNKNIALHIRLNAVIELNEIVVSGNKTETIDEKSQMSAVKLPAAQIKSLPAFMGEVDVLKVIQLLPGVQSGNEGSSGLYVRGGSPDQNLILLDGVPVYNVNHLFGFFSVFNADAINNVELIKGGFPARYGGRLSSVLSINMKEGNKKTYHGTGSVGIIASKLTLEGPLITDKASFVISGRRTYIDLLAKPFIAKQFPDGGGVGYYFYDLNGKINYELNEKDHVYLSAYNGIDKFYFKDVYRDNQGSNIYESNTAARLAWGNLTGVMRWNHQFTQKLFSNATVNYSKYQFDVSVSDETLQGILPAIDTFSANLRYFSGIRDWSGKLDFDYIPAPNHFIKFGIGSIWHTFTPGAIQFKLSNTGTPPLDTTLSNNKTVATELDYYLEDDMKIGNRIKMNAGIHGSAFLVDGQNYFSVQPRLSLRFMIIPGLSAKASYAQMAQYIHLLTNSGVGLPTDLWVPTTKRIKPENSWQIAAGLAKSFDPDIEISLEGYYKVMNNIIEYKEGSSFVDLNGTWEDRVTAGKGWAYGSELFIQKKSGKTTGWIGYTLSWTYRQFADINFGKAFPYKYDRRHDVSVAVMHKLNKSWDFSATWVYGTGNAISLPLAQYPSISPWGGISPWTPELYYYKERNGYRMASYHRFDFGVTYHRETPWGQHSLNLSVYNAYNRKNPFFIYYGWDDKGNRAFTQVSLFPLLPSLSYNFNF